MTRRRLASLLVVLMGLGLVISGSILLSFGVDGRHQVSAQLRQEHITVSPDTPDKAYANKKVLDGPSAKAQADAIWLHMMKASNGRAYADISSKASADDLKVRSTLQTGDSLRSALLAASLSWEIANFVLGLGIILLLVGLGVLLVYWLRRSNVE